MNIKGLAICLSSSILALSAAGAAHADNDDRDRGGEHKHYDNKQHSGELVEAVRNSTRRFKDVNRAKAEGYQLLFGCVSGPDDGAMGMHYVNMELVGIACWTRAAPRS